MKLLLKCAHLERISVAPLAGAWIEIFLLLSIIEIPSSLPSRERGLKCDRVGKVWLLGKSLPSRERGLKFLQQWFFDTD